MTVTQSEEYDVPYGEYTKEGDDDNGEETKYCSICGKGENVDFKLQMVDCGVKGNHQFRQWYFCEKHGRYFAKYGGKIDFAIEDEAEMYEEGQLE